MLHTVVPNAPVNKMYAVVDIESFVLMAEVALGTMRRAR